LAYLHARNCLISTSGLKSDVIIVFLDMNFLYDAGIPAIRENFKVEIGIFMFAWIFVTFSPKMAVLGRKIGEGVVRC